MKKLLLVLFGSGFCISLFSADFITHENTSDKLVYTFVKTILENFDEFKTLHPVYSNITKKSLLEGLGAPLHKSAQKYFTEIGLLNK